MNLTELKDFAERMAGEADADKQAYTLYSQLEPDRLLEWGDLVKLLPDQRAALTVAVQPPLTHPDGQASKGGAASLALGSNPPFVNLNGPWADIEERRKRLYRRWRQLGRPRRMWWAVYPVALVMVLVAAVAPIVALWLRHRLSMWFIPGVLLAVWAGFVAGVPLVRQAVAKHKRRRGTLKINFRLIEHVLEYRATVRLAVWSGIGGALVGAAVTGVGIWATVVASK